MAIFVYAFTWLWWLLRTSVRKISHFAFDFCIFSELEHSQMDDVDPQQQLEQVCPQ